jgi:hypothetical protein
MTRLIKVGILYLLKKHMKDPYMNKKNWERFSTWGLGKPYFLTLGVLWGSSNLPLLHHEKQVSFSNWKEGKSGINVLEMPNNGLTPCLFLMLSRSEQYLSLPALAT